MKYKNIIHIEYKINSYCENELYNIYGFFILKFSNDTYNNCIFNIN